jgi:hypothetical protein
MTDSDAQNQPELQYQARLGNLKAVQVMGAVAAFIGP